MYRKLLKENINSGIKEKINDLVKQQYRNLQDVPKSIIDSILKHQKKQIITDQIVSTDPDSNTIIKKNPNRIKILIQKHIELWMQSPQAAPKASSEWKNKFEPIPHIFPIRMKLIRSYQNWFY